MRQLRRLKTVKKTEQSDACHFIEYVSCKEACVHLREVRIVLKQGYMEPDRLRSFCTMVSVIQAPISIPGRPFIKKQSADYGRDYSRKTFGMDNLSALKSLTRRSQNRLSTHSI